jgi:release factor glutamine methyltransferase
MTIQEAQQQLLFQLYPIYDNREAAAIANWVMENVTEMKRIDRLVNKDTHLPLSKVELLNKYTDELLKHRPVQYVLKESWFAGMKFYVDENVLIPRPETEELVDWVIKDFQSSIIDASSPLFILDIGTGSGCIPIALKKKLSFAEIYSCDLSEGALQVAKKNASDHQVDIHFLHLDFLNKANWIPLPAVDIIVSNPPYIPLKDSATMMRHVKDHEPHMALFVDNDRPLVFYEALVEFAQEKLKENGKIFFEMHEEQSSNIKKLFSFPEFFEIEVRKDMQGKERMLKATRLL